MTEVRGPLSPVSDNVLHVPCVTGFMHLVSCLPRAV